MSNGLTSTKLIKTSPNFQGSHDMNLKLCDKLVDNRLSRPNITQNSKISKLLMVLHIVDMVTFFDTGAIF